MESKHTEYVPVKEPITATLTRTILLAVAIGSVTTLSRRGAYTFEFSHFTYWSSSVLSVFWYTFGGHWVELFYLNVLRLHLPTNRFIQISVRLFLWLVGGCLLTVGAIATLLAFGRHESYDLVKISAGGVSFVTLELIVHSILQILKRPSFWNGRG